MLKLPIKLEAFLEVCNVSCTQYRYATEMTKINPNVFTVKTDYIPAMPSSNYIAAIHNITQSLYTWTCTTHPRQDVGMVESILWCHSHLVWLVLEGSIPTCACFHSCRKLFCDLLKQWSSYNTIVVCRLKTVQFYHSPPSISQCFIGSYAVTHSFSGCEYTCVLFCFVKLQLPTTLHVHQHARHTQHQGRSQLF